MPDTRYILGPKSGSTKRSNFSKDYINLFCCIQKCDETQTNRQAYFKCHASNCVARILSIGINVSSGGRVSCVVVDSRAGGHHQSSSKLTQPRKTKIERSAVLDCVIFSNSINHICAFVSSKQGPGSGS